MNLCRIMCSNDFWTSVFPTASSHLCILPLRSPTMTSSRCWWNTRRRLVSFFTAAVKHTQLYIGITDVVISHSFCLPLVRVFRNENTSINLWLNMKLKLDHFIFVIRVPLVHNPVTSQVPSLLNIHPGKKVIFKINLFHAKYSSNLLTYLLTYHLRLI